MKEQGAKENENPEAAMGFFKSLFELLNQDNDDMTPAE